MTTAATEAPRAWLTPEEWAAVTRPAAAGTAWRRRAVLVAPLLLVNTVAVYGQYSWALANLDDPGLTTGVPFTAATLHVLPALFAAAMESVALYLQHEANVARLAGDAVAKLAAASYAMAGVAGALNFLHWHDKNLSAAVAFALLSAISPWLWGIRSRSEHREQLRRRGLVEERAVKFSTARWVLYPRATFRALRLAVWAGVQDPRAAVALLEAQPTDKGQGQQDQGQDEGQAQGRGHAGDQGQQGQDEEGQDQDQDQDAAGDEGQGAGKGQDDAVVAWVRERLAERPQPKRAEVLRQGMARFNVSESTMKRRYGEATRPRLVRRRAAGVGPAALSGRLAPGAD